jgi:hypothetical protein
VFKKLVVIALVAGTALLVFQSMPDIRRYMRIRSM